MSRAPRQRKIYYREKERDWLEVKVTVDSKGIFRRDLGSRTCTIC